MTGVPAPRSPGATLERYILAGILRRAAAIVAILVLILELENATRLVAQVDRLDRPFAMLSTLCGLLAPEYVAMALPFALFLATALAFRQFAMRSELAAMLAAGVSRRRLIRGPLLLGILCAPALLALRGYVQPICEAQLAARGDQIRAGLFGLGLTVGELAHVAPDTALLVGGAGPRAGELSDIFVDSPTGTFSAPRANAVFGADGALALTMFDGRAVEHGAVRRGRAAFRRLTVRIPLAIPPARRLTPDQRLEFLTQSELLTLAPQALARAATTTFLSRITLALFCVVAPVIGVGAGIVAPRRVSPAGLGIGLALVLLFIRLNEGTRALPVDLAAVTQAALLAASLAAGLWLYRRKTAPA